jgi:hypothetical protein
MSIIKIPIWVNLTNILIQFRKLTIFEDIKNILGRHLTIDIYHIKLGIFTDVGICVEFDINKGLLNKLLLQRKDSIWTQEMDYENTIFDIGSFNK